MKYYNQIKNTPEIHTITKLKIKQTSVEQCTTEVESLGSMAKRVA